MVATADVYTVKFNRCNISSHLGTIPTFESVMLIKIKKHHHDSGFKLSWFQLQIKTGRNW